MSHFSRVKTRINDKDLLIRCLEDMDLQISQNTEINGFEGIQSVDIAVQMVRGYDVGFLRNSQGSYDIVADWWGVKDTKKEFFVDDLKKQLEEVENRIKRQYALKTIEEETRKKGFNMVEKVEEKDGSIRIVVRRWQ